MSKLNPEDNINLFEEIASNYNMYQEEKIINDNDLNILNDFSTQFKEQITKLQDEGRKLKIGVVGQVNSGKSTFLNALLFEGDDLLPKSATPMTAALTVIGYGKQPKAEINFYNQTEWQNIKERAEKYDQLIIEERNETGFKDLSDKELEKMIDLPEELKASKFLVEKANNSQIDIYNNFGEKKELTCQSIDDLLDKLENYVGVNGDFTPLVKNTELYIDHEGLKGIEMVDTPGMNDPIKSRGRKTREFLKECDVVFMLSFSGQFLDKSDLTLLTNNLPQEGISEVILLGSKIDSPLLGLSMKYESYQTALDSVKSSLSDHAQEMLQPLLDEKRRQREVFTKLESSFPPQFISGLAYNAVVNSEKLTKNDKWPLKRLKEAFSDFEMKQEQLLDLANLESIKNQELPRIRAKKEELIEQKYEEYIIGQREKFIDKLKKIKEELNMELTRLRDKDLERLQAQQQALEKGMNLAHDQIDIIFDQKLKNIKGELSTLETELKTAAHKHKQVNDYTETKQKTKVFEKEGIIPWLQRKLGIGGKRKEYENVTNSYANIYDAVDQINEFLLYLEKKMQEEIDNMFDAQKLGDDLSAKVFEVLKNKNLVRELDKEAIGIPIRRVVNRIELPTIEFNTKKYKEQITEKFTGTKVKNEDIESLQRLLRETVDEILEKVKKELDKISKEIISKLKQAKEDFIDQVLAETKEKVAKLEEKMNSKEENIDKYEKIVKQLEFDLTRLNY